MFPEKDIMVAFDIILEYNAFDAHWKLGLRTVIEFKNSFSQERKAIGQFWSDEQVLFAQAEGQFPFLKKGSCFYKTFYAAVVNDATDILAEHRARKNDTTGDYAYNQ